MEGQVELVLLLVALFGDGHFRPVESVFFHYSLDACPSVVEFFWGVEFAKLQAGGAGQLVGGRIVRNAFDRQHAHKKIGDRQKAQPDAGSVGAIRFGLNVGEAPGGKKSLHRVMQRFARERFADLERCGREQRSRFFRRNPRQLDLINR